MNKPNSEDDDSSPNPESARQSPLHPILREARQIYSESYPDRRGFLRPHARRCINLQVTKSALPNAIQFMNRLFERLKREGYSFSVSEDGRDAEATIEKTSVVIGIREYVYERMRELTAKEKADLKRNPNTYIYDRNEYIPTGKFILFVEVWGSYSRRECQVTKYSSESLLFDAFVKRLATAIESRRKHDLEREQAERERAEQRRLREEAERRRQEEQQRIDQLNQIVSDWQYVQSVAQFLAAIEQHYKQANASISPDSGLGHWMQWARGHAASLNPLLNGVIPAPGDDQENTHAAP